MRYGHLLAGLIFLIFLFILGLVLLSGPGDKIDVQAPPEENASSSNVNTAAVNPPAANQIEGYYSSPTAGYAMTVTYGRNGFTPAELTVPLGTTIYFLNQSGTDFWPASGMHPTHSVYPVSGGCIGSVFDSCARVPSGTAWSFKFDRRGSWPYHNHLLPGHTGTVVVQ